MNTNEYSKTGNEGLVSNEDRFNLSRKIFVGNISYRVIVLYMLYSEFFLIFVKFYIGRPFASFDLMIINLCFTGVISL